MNRRLFASLAAGFLLASTYSFAQATTWAIDKNHSQADFEIRHLGVSNVRGSISGVTGTVVWDENDPSKSSVTAVLDATTVDTGNSMRDKDLKSDHFFNVDKFPTITFKSTSVSKVDGKLKITGDLTITGIAKPITFDVDGPSAPQKGMGGKIVTGFEATGVLKRSDYTFGPKYTPPMLGEEVKFTIDIEAAKQ